MQKFLFRCSFVRCSSFFMPFSVLIIKHFFKIGTFIFYLKIYIFATLKLSRGVIGNTSDSGSEEFRFET